jgi:glycosyltransferase involved in cell wall biosynthesis
VNTSVQMETSKDLVVDSNNLPRARHAKVALAIQTTVPGSLDAFFKGQLAWLQRHDLQVHTVSAPGEELKWVSEVEKVRTHAIPMTRSFSPGKDLLALWRLVRLYRKVGFTIVHAFTPKGGFLGMLAATVARCPVRLFTIWGLAAEPVSFRVRLMLLADKVSCALAHKVFVECPSIAELAVTKGLCRREKLTVLPAWSTSSLDSELTDLAELAQTRAAARRDWGLPADAVVLGFVGRVVRDKGVHELVQAFEHLALEFPELHLLIVGVREAEDAVDQGILRRIDIHARIRCTGFQKDVLPLLSAMDVLVHPSYREGLPTAPLEAAARGLPVVAARIPGCIDAVQDGVSGLLVAPRDARGLAEAIRCYLNNPELRRLHGMNGREWVLRQYDRRKAWAALLKEYIQLLTERGIVPYQARAVEALQ